MAKFKNVPPRTTIDLAGATAIYTRQFGAVPDGVLLPEILHRIKTFGKCECGCKAPLAGHCDFDHHIPNSIQKQEEGQPKPKIDWRALLPNCHMFKTKGDVFNISKLKRTAKKYNPTELDVPIAETEKPKAKIQSGGFYKHPTKKRTLSGKVVDR